MLVRAHKHQKQEVRLPKPLAPLTRMRRWIDWRWELRNGIRTKPPISVTGDKIDATNRKNWLTYAEAVRYASTVGGGIGFVLIDSGIGALDLDDCRDRQTGRLDAWAQEIIDKADGAYLEITPSGQGLRIIGTAKGKPVHTNWRIGNGRIEVFRNTQRYITVSGDQLGDCDRLTNVDNLIDALVAANGATKKRPVVIVRRVSLLAAHEICRKHKIYGKLRSFLLYGEPVIGQRSTVHYWMARCLLERGLPTSESFILLKNTAWNKHRHEDRCDEMVWRLIERAAAEPITPWRPS